MWSDEGMRKTVQRGEHIRVPRGPHIQKQAGSGQGISPGVWRSPYSWAGDHVPEA